MKYFDGIQFAGSGSIPDTTGILHREFAGYYGIQYTHTGRLQFSLNDESPKIYDAPCVFISAPGAQYHYGAPENEKRYHNYVCFSGPRTDAFMEGGLLDPAMFRTVTPVYAPERFLNLIRELDLRIRNPEHFNSPYNVLILEELLVMIKEQPPARSCVNILCEQEIKKLCDNIRRHPAEHFDFQAEADELSISYSHFRRLFHVIAGNSPAQYVINCRMTLARRLLSETVLSVHQIAENCGFSDEYYFSRLFRAHVQMTPTAYRREFRIKDI